MGPLFVLSPLDILPFDDKMMTNSLINWRSHEPGTKEYRYI